MSPVYMSTTFYAESDSGNNVFDISEGNITIRSGDGESVLGIKYADTG